MAHEHDPFDPAGDPILSWAAKKGLVGANGTAATVVERPKAEGVKEQVGIRLRQMRVDLRRVIPAATLDRLAVELGTTPKSVNSAVQRLRKAEGIQIRPHTPETTERRRRERQEPATARAEAAPAAPATSDPTQQARALAVQIAAELLLMAQGNDREALLTAARLVQGVLG